MKTFEKIYIGKGKQQQNFNIMRISLKVADILKLSHEFEGVQYITFEVAKMKQADNYGNEYTVYVNNLVETPVTAASQVNDPPAKPKKVRKAKNQIPDNYGSTPQRMEDYLANNPDDDLPF